MDDKTIDVLIVGAGPSGTTLAIDLARRGLDVRIIDKASCAFAGSRAKGVQPRSLEVFHDIGVLKPILSAGSLYPKLGIHLGPFTLPWKMFNNIEGSEPVPHPNTWLIPQFRIDRALHARLKELGRNVEFETALADFSQADDHVAITVATARGQERIKARYLVGMDGGASTVRKQLDIDFVGNTDEQDRILIVDAVTSGLSKDRWHIWPRPGGRFIGACPLPHSEVFQWMIRLPANHPVPEDAQRIVETIRARTGNRNIMLRSIQWQSVFRPNIRLAQKYRSGRVFIGGDAAHVHTPAGAQGLNTGIQDAYNLGWKLAQVLAGANERLLDSYESERQPIAAGVLGLSTKKYQGIAKLDPSAIRRGKDEQQLTLTYRGGPLAAGKSQTTTALWAGDRAPDALLCRSSDGQIRSLHDIFSGPHFTVIAYGSSAAKDMAELPWASAGAPLKRVAINAPKAIADETLTDQKDSFRAIYGLSGDALILVRPDGYIGHIATSDMLASTRDAARSMTPQSRLHAAHLSTI
jgi:2-polyprenyl-6-methoxyphenol hydroxylase-like FAD-dependent oxidoreductase